MTNQSSSTADGPIPIPSDGSSKGPVARFTGTLDDLSVADLIQILQLAGKSATITLTQDGVQSHLWCSAGAIVDAESGRLRGEAAVYRMLGFERGAISADLRSASRPRNIFSATQRLLLEAARRKDESVALRRKLGDEQHCRRLADSIVLDQLGLSPVELCLLRSFADARSLCETLDSSELGDFETLTALTAWVDAGVLVDAGTRCAPVAHRPPHSDAPPTPAASLPPFVASVHPARSVPRRAVVGAWVWAALAALVLIPCGYVLGGRTARVLEPSAAIPVPSDVAGTARVPSSYAVELRVDPPEAEISLDRGRPSVGRLQTRLARNGAVHEVRLASPGFLPATILFVDTAPPADVRLEPLPPAVLSTVISAPAPVASHTGGKPSSSDAVVGAQKPRKRQPPIRGTLRREAARTSLRARARTAGSNVPVTNEPHAQVSDHPGPILRVLD